MPSWRGEENFSLLLKYKSIDFEHCTASQVSERLIHGVQTRLIHGKGKGWVSPLQKCHAIKGYRKKQSSTQYLSRQSMRLISFKLRPVFSEKSAIGKHRNVPASILSEKSALGERHNENVEETQSDSNPQHQCWRDYRQYG